MNPELLKKIVEATLFAHGKPMTVEQLQKVFLEEERPEKIAVRDALEEIAADWDSRGIILKEVASGFRFQAVEEVTPWVARLWEEKPPKYSRAVLETLALIAYRQPITRSEIEEIRGVSVSSHIMKSLQEREWVRTVGHKDVPGRPALYATTKDFLDYFNLQSLEQLPPLSEIRDLDAIAEELEKQQDEAVAEAIEEHGERPAETETTDSMPEEGGEASDTPEAIADQQTAEEGEHADTSESHQA